MYDRKNLERLGQLDRGAPQGMDAFWAFDKAAFAEGAIDAKTKQLIALAVCVRLCRP